MLIVKYSRIFTRCSRLLTFQNIINTLIFINIILHSPHLDQQPLLQNGLGIDLRYRATYGNPFLRTSNASLPPLPPPSTANPASTPAPPPYNATHATRTAAASGGSVVGVGTTSLTPQVSSPSGQFILPANGNLKKGALATHV